VWTEKDERDVWIDALVFRQVLDIFEKPNDEDISYFARSPDEQGLHLSEKLRQAIQTANRHSIDDPLCQSPYVVVLAGWLALPRVQILQPIGRKVRAEGDQAVNRLPLVNH
jgi:hypothetical protein